MELWHYAVFCVVMLALGTILFLPRWRRRRAERRIARGRDTFHQRREWLEARFMTLASASGTPRGLTWADCDFADEVSFARDRTTNDLRALVAVSIKFEAIEGGGMEEVEAVAYRKAATVVFRYENDIWQADNRAYFNLSPAETIERFHERLEVVD